jgi:hypothetical protein
MKLPEYKNIEEKSEHFQIVHINSIEEFNKIYKSHSVSDGIFRGVNSSSYKIYTSLQRHHIVNDISEYDTEKYLSRVRNQSLIKKYFETFKIPPSKLSIWSYLQHYGAPTPFIDFSTDFSKALYFAVENFDVDTYEKKDDFTDHISLYFISKKDLELINIPKVFESFKETKKLSMEIGKSYDDYDYDFLIEHLDRIFDINVLNVFLINHSEDFVEVYNTYNNIRIVAQDGLFVNNTYKNLPLEEALKKFFIEATQYQVSPWDEIDTPEAEKINSEYMETIEKNKLLQARLMKNIITSYEIKKELIPEIRKIIGLEKSDIYPNQSELVWDLYNSTE